MPNFTTKLMIRFQTIMASGRCTDTQTDRHKFIESFWLNLEVQKRSGISKGDQEKIMLKFQKDVLIFGLGISKECNTILQNFQG